MCGKVYKVTKTESFFKIFIYLLFIYLFIWLSQVLVAACGIFSRGM